MKFEKRLRRLALTSFSLAALVALAPAAFAQSGSTANPGNASSSTTAAAPSGGSNNAAASGGSQSGSA